MQWWDVWEPAPLPSNNLILSKVGAKDHHLTWHDHQSCCHSLVNWFLFPMFLWDALRSPWWQLAGLVRHQKRTMQHYQTMAWWSKHEQSQPIIMATLMSCMMADFIVTLLSSFGKWLHQPCLLLAAANQLVSPLTGCIGTSEIIKWTWRLHFQLGLGLHWPVWRSHTLEGPAVQKPPTHADSYTCDINRSGWE